MKKTRNLFVLVGNEFEISRVIKEVDFKGIVAITSLTSDNIVNEIFGNNKSIVCSSFTVSNTMKIEKNAIYIQVTNNESRIHLPNRINTSLGNISEQFEYIAITNNCDIGDHKSNSSGFHGTPKIKDCSYCNFINGISTANQPKILYETTSFFVMSTFGEFIKGYLLIIPKKHIMSMAWLNSLERKEFIEVLEDIRYILKLTYNISDFLVWENGTGNFGIGKAKDSVVHAHTHIAPSTLNIQNIQKIIGFSLTQICTTDFPKYAQNSYLLIEDSNTDTWWINDNPNVYIPRQYIRQILAEEHNIYDVDAWNWRTHPYYDLMIENDNDISSALLNNFNVLPERIKTNIITYAHSN